MSKRNILSIFSAIVGMTVLARPEFHSFYLGILVFLDNQNFNQWLIQEGYAYEYTYRLPYKYQREFKEAQKEAAKNQRGLWAVNTCNGSRILSSNL